LDLVVLDISEIHVLL
jgi:hypothetical protein